MAQEGSADNPRSRPFRRERSGDNPRGQSFRRGKSGNPAGRPRGARNRATLAAEALLEGEAEALTRKAIELAVDQVGEPHSRAKPVVRRRRAKPIERYEPLYGAVDPRGGV